MGSKIVLGLLMFNHLTIKNFAIVKDLDIDFRNGMTAITGETGAGKSIAIDALGLCLGDRADAASVRTGTAKAEITAEFDISDAPQAIRYLDEHEIESEDQTVIIRRVISSDGKSKSYINGTSATLAQLKTIGELLINIHGQSAHHQLFKEDFQLCILDNYGDLNTRYENLSALAKELSSIKSKISQLEENREKYEARKSLLHFQLDELRKADPKEGEFEELEQEYSRLANIDDLISSCHESMELIRDSDNYSILGELNTVIGKMESVAEFDSSLGNVLEMLREAQISLEESYDEIHSYADNIDSDPERLKYLEKRISHYEELAHKYHVRPEELFRTFQEIRTEYESMNNLMDSSEDLQNRMIETRRAYIDAAAELSELRKKYSVELSQKITDHMHELAMPYGQFSIEVNFDKFKNPSSKGNDSIRFLVSINPGQAPGLLGDTVSGGELARISLAIQEIYAEKVSTPSLIFDEVDTGISGQTANVVGRLLHKIGETTQVICVTHLPQVASCAHNHFFVQKKVVDQSTETSMTKLDREGRIKEIARLLSGEQITKNSLASAEELLNQNCGS